MRFPLGFLFFVQHLHQIELFGTFPLKQTAVFGYIKTNMPHAVVRRFRFFHRRSKQLGLAGNAAQFFFVKDADTAELAVVAFAQAYLSAAHAAQAFHQQFVGNPAQFIQRPMEQNIEFGTRFFDELQVSFAHFFAGRSAAVQLRQQFF